ncbi:hypothetical protein KDA08_00385 [Candidatus Saccharibacteria bacterium]|nr:hypothetical protein [Candidatus Saccharibacteria bacterium]
MERPYLDVDGNRHPASAVDAHHVFARQYARSCNDRQFINLEALKVPLFRTWHNVGVTALHHNVANLRLPDRGLQHIIRNNLQDSVGENIYDRYIDMVSVVASAADYSLNPGIRKDAARVSRNLRKQSYYILNGQVRDLSEASHDLSD